MKQIYHAAAKENARFLSYGDAMLLKNEFKGKILQEFARVSEIHTPRGVIHTPAFMPVGTNGTVKGLTTNDLNETNSEIILGNTFHLMLRPGDKLIKNLGGLHKFINWNKPILTDSGGFSGLEFGRFSKNIRRRS